MLRYWSASGKNALMNCRVVEHCCCFGDCEILPCLKVFRFFFFWGGGGLGSCFKVYFLSLYVYFFFYHASIYQACM